MPQIRLKRVKKLTAELTAELIVSLSRYEDIKDESWWDKIREQGGIMMQYSKAILSVVIGDTTINFEIWKKFVYF